MKRIAVAVFVALLLVGGSVGFLPTVSSAYADGGD